MPSIRKAVLAPNLMLAEARGRMASPGRIGQGMSRPELADTVNAAFDQLHSGRGLTAHLVDSRWIAKLERGEHRWPSDERRSALRHVLSAATDAELGLRPPRRRDGEDASSP